MTFTQLAAFLAQRVFHGLQSLPGLSPQIVLTLDLAMPRSDPTVWSGRTCVVCTSGASRDHLAREQGFFTGIEPMMRELVIIITAFVALSAMVRSNGHFVPRPTGPLPAVNVP